MQSKRLFLDNGAWDYKSTMSVEEYDSVINNCKPKYVVVPDKLGDIEATMNIV